jgi:hypothetical protein
MTEELDLWKMTFAEAFMNNRILVYNVDIFINQLVKQNYKDLR